MTEPNSFEERTRIKITNSGIEIPEEYDIYNAIMDYWNSVFGGNLRTDNRQSPQGQFAMSMARQIFFKNQQLLELINQFNVNTASGVFLENLYANFGIYKDKGSRSLALCQCTCMGGTKLFAGDRIKNANGDEFALAEDHEAVIPDEVTVDVIFSAVELGAVACAAHTLTRIVDARDGWISVDNRESGTVGTDDTRSLVTCQCVLKPGSSILVGDKIKNTDGDEFYCVNRITVPADRVTDDLFFNSVNTGNISTAPNTLNEIVTSRPGWLSVNNSSDGIDGYAEENDDQFRIRAMNSHQINALGTTRALLARLNDLEGVVQVFVEDNRTKETVKQDGVDILANSTYICIRHDGTEATLEAIGNVLHYTCSTCTYIGNTFIDVPIENAPDGITDRVYFQTAVPKQIYIRVSIKTLPYYSDSTNNTIKDIILDNFNGSLENIQACRIGDLIEANRFYENLAHLQSKNECSIANIEISDDNNSWGSSVKIPITDYPVLIEDNITVVAN